jgi:16S rRNA C1402 (ribose-2'-O) methylase RsmI
MTELIEPSHAVSDSEAAQLLTAFECALPGAAAMAVCGSLPDGSNYNIYTSTVDAAHRAGVPVFVLYESPHRIVDLVAAIAGMWPQCLLCVCSDLTKRYERIYRGPAYTVLEQLRANPGVEKGEYCLAVDISMLPPTPAQAEMPPVEAWMLSRLLDGADLVQAAREAQDAGYARNEVYRAKLKIADMFEAE